MTMGFSAGERGRRGVFAAAAIAIAGTAVALTVPAMAAQAGPAGRVLTAGQVGSRAEVPWGKVGPGWALAMYSASQGGEGVRPKSGPSTLYLVNPAGGRYSLSAWSARSARSRWYLQAWSGDASRALFTSAPAWGSTVPEHVYQLQLRTGAITGFTLPARVTAVGYTRPDGLNILAEEGTPTSLDSKITLLRYNLAGQLQKALATVTGLGQVAYQPAGAEIAAGSLRGLELISNQGGVIRSLPVPGARNGCGAVRWWSAGTILASCSTPGSAGPRLWLVPASGAAPAALTPARTGHGFDFGDFNAWQLPSGLYLDGFGACGTLVIGRQPTRGPEQMVSVPGSASSVIVTATGSRLMVERINGCSPGTSLVWFNPATRALTIAIPAGHNQHGVVGVVPYLVTGKF
jgi:TolB protein